MRCGARLSERVFPAQSHKKPKEIPLRDPGWIRLARHDCSHPQERWVYAKRLLEKVAVKVSWLRADAA